MLETIKSFQKRANEVRIGLNCAMAGHSEDEPFQPVYVIPSLTRGHSGVHSQPFVLEKRTSMSRRRFNPKGCLTFVGIILAVAVIKGLLKATENSVPLWSDAAVTIVAIVLFLAGLASAVWLIVRRVRRGYR